jgi:hypothetical protein
MTRLLCVSLLAGLIATPALAQAPSGPCKAVFDAMLKETTTPHHAASVRNGAAQGEVIATADAVYVKTKDVWKKSPLTPKAQLEMQQENIRDATSASCTALPDEVVAGKPVSVWHAHYEQRDLGVSESKIWIAKASGLPVRTEVSIQAGEKVSLVTTFDYDHITAPAVK